MSALSLLVAYLLLPQGALCATPSNAPMKSPSSTSFGTIDYSCLHTNNWLVNKAGTRNSYLGSLTELQSMIYSSTGYMTVTTGGIPKYTHSFTTSEGSALNSRPHSAYDFTTGRTTASIGTALEFGSNIGYGCSSAQGCFNKQTTVCSLGWWPPGNQILFNLYHDKNIIMFF